MGAVEQVSDLLRQSDRDAYVSALFAPEAARRSLNALFAFAAETAKVCERTHEPLTGEIRLQWWRDTIEAGAPTGSPVADELLEAIARHDLPKGPFLDLLEARLFDLYDDPMPDRTFLEAYCGETVSAVIQLGCVALDAARAPDFAEASGHAGCALAIARIVAGLPLQRARGQCYIPADLLAAAGSSREELLSSEPGEGGVRAAAAMIALGREHLGAFRTRARGLPASLRPAFLPVASAPLIFGRAERMGAAVLREPAAVGPLRRQWTLWLRAMRGWR